MPGGEGGEGVPPAGGGDVVEERPGLMVCVTPARLVTVTEPSRTETVVAPLAATWTRNTVPLTAIVNTGVFTKYEPGDILPDTNLKVP